MDKKDRVIVSISFIHRGERISVKANSFGKFRLPVTNVVEGRVKTSYKNLTSKQVVDHPQVIDGDPVLTLKNGDKVRVYHGGDKSYMVPSADGILTKHDSTLKSLVLKNAKKKKKTINLGSSIKKDLQDDYDDIWTSGIHGFYDDMDDS